jgi:protein-tyrosine phosphatase
MRTIVNVRVMSLEETPPAMERMIALENVFNLRDLGGYPTRDDRRVRWRRAFRGAGLHRLAGADLEIVHALGLATAVDLRTHPEVAANGLAPGPVARDAVAHLPLIREVWDRALLDPAVPADVFLFERYREMLDEGAPVIRTVVELFSDEANLPGVFYCAAGKDRTGVVAAMLLDALGVEHELIAQDYHVSKAQADRIRERARRRAETTTMVSQPEAFMQAPPEAMRRLLAWVQDTHGGAAGYLDSIGVARDRVTAMRAVLTEPAAA